MVDPCAAFSPITFDRLRDTEETIREVKGHNARWDAACGGTHADVR